MMQLKRTEISILRNLLKSASGLDSFTLFRRLKISFSEFTKSVNRLSDLRLIALDGERINILKDGVELISSFYTGPRMLPVWRQVPKEFIGRAIEIGDFYIPSKALLDKSFTEKNS